MNLTEFHQKLSDAPLMMEEREQRDEALLRQALEALKAENARLRDALEEIRNRSWTGVMRSNKFELEVALANICLFVDVVLWKGNSND